MTAAANPLMTAPTSPYRLPPFGQFTPDQIEPAYDAALAAHAAEYRAIIDNPAPATFENTIAAIERAGEALSWVGAAFWTLASTDTTPELQAIERRLSPKLAAHFSRIATDPGLFARVEAVYQAQPTLGLDAEQSRILERTHTWLKRSGAMLDAAGRARMAELSERLADLSTRFSQNVLADEQAFILPLETEDDLAGLPDFLRQAAANAAETRDCSAPYAITLSRSLIEPFLTFSARRDLREAAFRAWTARGDQANANNNAAIITETLALRQALAELMGYADFASYKLDDEMAERPERAEDLLNRVWPAAKARAAAEQARLEALARADGINGALEPWDWRYYSEQIRQADYALDEHLIKPYLPLDAMIAAAFYVAGQLFGLRFEEREGLALHHKDARAWEVYDRAGQPVGLFIGDYFARPSKRSGAWMSAMISQERLRRTTRPVIINVMNFAPGAAGQPALLSLDDAKTLFHEFGHGLHGLLSDVTFPSLAGTNVAGDFVELPSQLYEHWLTTDAVLSRFAKHYQTGEAMPKALIDKILAARTFNQGFATVEYVASALVDIAWHRGKQLEPFAPTEQEAELLQSLGMPQAIAPRHRAPHFLHVFAGDGYAAGYYSYLWSEVLDADAFAAFEETGDIFNADLAHKLKAHIYSAGNRQPAAQAYVAFRGRLPEIDGLLRKRGLDRVA